jgi:nucleotide-binding universal stress UspA family protein
MSTGRPVVVGFSASAASAAALRWAVAEALCRQLPVTVLHVDDPGARADLPPTRPRGRARDREVEAAVADRVSRVLGDVLDPDDDAGPTISLVFRHGPLLEVLESAVKDASVLVVGRAHWCRHADLADQLRRRVGCPVIVVPAIPEPVDAGTGHG